MIIGISGKMSCGKDTIGEIIKDYQKDKNWEIKKFATKIRQIASILTNIPVENFGNQSFKNSNLPIEWDYLEENNWVENKLRPMTIRIFLQKLGTESLRKNLHPNIWINALFCEYKSNGLSFKYNTDKSHIIPDKNFPNWIITDVRTIGEAKKIKEFNGILIRVNKNERIYSSLHETETELDDYKFDFIIDNNGTIEDLKNETIQIINGVHF